MKQTKDQIYSQPQTADPFQFDHRVAAVFADMISRSVPGYGQVLNLIPTISRQFQHPNHYYYDLGCSLGAGMLAMAEGLRGIDCSIVGVDNSAAMLEQAKPAIEAYATAHHKKMVLEHADITNFNLKPAAMVLMNFTLQFVPLDQRDNLIQKVYKGLVEGGAFVLSEKIKFKQPEIAKLLTNIHHQYKTDQGYSELEISQKRDAIETVLIPESLRDHTTRLRKAGFSIITPCLQNLQFISIIAVK